VQTQGDELRINSLYEDFPQIGSRLVGRVDLPDHTSTKSSVLILRNQRTNAEGAGHLLE
jgi:hypothetical protein